MKIKCVVLGQDVSINKQICEACGEVSAEMKSQALEIVDPLGKTFFSSYFQLEFYQLLHRIGAR
jgi:hypothetical protein